MFPSENVLSALTTVYKYNVLRFQDGNMGAVNGMRPNGQVRLSMLLEHNDLVVTVVTIPTATNVYNAANQSEFR